MERMENILKKIKPDCVALEGDCGILDDLTSYISSKLFRLMEGGKNFEKKQVDEIDAITRYCEENQVPLYYIDTSYWRQINKIFFLSSFLNPVSKYLEPKKTREMRDLRKNLYGKIIYSILKNRNKVMEKNIKFLISTKKYEKIACIVGRFHFGDEYFGLERLLMKKIKT